MGLARTVQDKDEAGRRPRSRLRAWGMLIGFSVLIWAFGAIGPWVFKNIPGYQQIVEVIEEQDINANAYFYTEIKASGDAEEYLRESIRLAGHRDAHFNVVFMSGVVLCILILGLGYRLLPDDRKMKEG